jgi:hypothetical protein
MTTIKLDSKINPAVQLSLHDLTRKIYGTPGLKLVGLVELAHVERTEVADDEDKESSVKIRIAHLEIGRGDQEHHLRRALDALFRQRTADGTLDEDLNLVVDERAVELLGDTLDANEVARLRSSVKGWDGYLRQAMRETTTSGLLASMQKLRSAMQAVLVHAEDVAA